MKISLNSTVIATKVFPSPYIRVYPRVQIYIHYPSSLLISPANPSINIRTGVMVAYLASTQAASPLGGIADGNNL